MHLAARAHVPDLRVAWQRAAFQEVNAVGTARLVGAAARSGVARFIYLSSAKVNGEFTAAAPYSAQDEPRPADAYAESKWEGELAVHDTSLSSQIRCATIRAPLVYGSGVRANFLRLMELIDRGAVLPFGAVRNLRSLISVWNLVDALIRVAEHPAAPGRIWMVSDGADVSTPELIRALARAMGKPARLVTVPVGMLYLAGALTARRSQVNRLCRSLVVDISETCSQLDWTPPLTLPEGLERTVAWYQARSGGGMI
jgi:nucleoside-diphosphate-sugar epimerase